MRFLLLSLCAFLFIDPALAQRDSSFGLSVGVNASSFAPDYGDDSLSELDLGMESRLGLGAAVFAELSLQNNLSAVAEISYAHRGYSYRLPFNTPEAVIERFFTSMDFVSLGVLGRVLPFGRRPHTPYVIAGPRIDALIGSDPGRIPVPEFYDLPPGSPDFYEDPFPEWFESMSLSGVFGLGIAMTPANWPELRAEIRYGRTLTDFLADVPVEGSVTGFDFSLGFAW